jgi:hypothetical protein
MLLLHTTNKHSMCQRLNLICSISLAADLRVLLRVVAEVSAQLHFLEVWQQYFFMGWGCEPHAQLPTWRTRVSFLLFGSSPLTCLAWEALPITYATASIALVIIWPHKPRQYAKVEGHHTHAWYVFHSTHPHWFKHNNNALCRMRYMKLLITVFSNLLLLLPS